MRRTAGRLETGWSWRNSPSAHTGIHARPMTTSRSIASPARRHPWRAVAAVGLWLLFCALGAAAFDLTTLARGESASLLQAQADLKASLVAAQAGLASDTSGETRAAILAASARDEAAAAGKRIDDDLALKPLSLVPWIHRQAAAARELNHVVEVTASAAVQGEDLVTGYQQARRAPGKPSAIDVTGRYYIAHEKQIESLATMTLGLPAEVHRVDRRDLVPELQSAYGRLDRTMSQVSSAAPNVETALRVAPVILGRDHPSHYLLLFADNGELRGGGGFIGTYAIAGFDRGAYIKPVPTSGYKITTPLLNVPAFRAGGSKFVRQPDPFLAVQPDTRDLSMNFMNAAYNVQWPDDARLAQELFASETGQATDGVIQLDPTTISYLLTVTGPIAGTREGHAPELVTPENAFNVILDQTRNGPGATDKSFLVSFQEGLMQRLETMPASQWGQVLKAMQRASEERHLMVSASDPAIQPLVTKYQLDRPVPPPGNDGLLPVFNNFAGDKSDRYTDRRTTITVSPDGTHHVQITLANHTPGARQSPFSIYRELIQFYIPPTATEVRASGYSTAYEVIGGPNGYFAWGPFRWGTDHGWLDYAVWVSIKTGDSRTVTLDYRTPALGKTFEFNLVKQPGAEASPIDLQLLGAGWASTGAVSDAGGLTWHLDSARDHDVSASRG